MFDMLLKEEGGKPQNTTFPSLSALFIPSLLLTRSVN